MAPGRRLRLGVPAGDRINRPNSGTATTYLVAVLKEGPKRGSGNG